jgi:hypothetical protein
MATSWIEVEVLHWIEVEVLSFSDQMAKSLPVCF